MTKTELYTDVLSKAFEQINDNDKFNSKLLELTELLKLENALNGVSIQNAIIESCIAAGVIASINQSDMTVIDDPDFDLFVDLVNKMGIEIHNLKSMLNRPNNF